VRGTDVNRPDLICRKVAISVLFDTVSVELICGDDYAAQVLYDDIVERMQSGQGIYLNAKPAAAASGGSSS
jgi:hypothetical protein